MKSESLTDQITEVMFSSRAFLDNPLSETELAERFGTSRTPIRDALKEMESTGIISRKKKLGVYLRSPMKRDIEEVYDLRTAIEGFAANLAAKNARRRDIALLEELAIDFTKSRKNSDFALCEKLNIEFHSMLIKMSENSLILKTVKRLRLIERAFNLANSVYKWSNRYQTPFPHEKIVEALKTASPEECESLMRSHIQNAKNELFKFLQKSESD